MTTLAVAFGIFFVIYYRRAFIRLLQGLELQFQATSGLYREEGTNFMRKNPSPNLLALTGVTNAHTGVDVIKLFLEEI